AHPEGVTTRQVSDEIKQAINAVDGTIRQVVKRKMVERRGRLWFPVGAPVTPKPTKIKSGYREHIIAVFAVEKGPLGAGAIFRGVQKIKPDAIKTSVDGE